MKALGVTGDFAAGIVGFRLAGLAPQIVHEAKRSLFNALAVGIGASRNPGAEIVLGVARRHAGIPVAPLLGRAERTDAPYAALANGFAAHVDDYDDTHLATVIHPAASVMATILALAPQTAPTGPQALRAFILGCEVELRVGVAVSPEHYDDGWHITGTAGVFGTTAAAAALWGLDGWETTRALGIAASSTLGHRESFGSMVKAFHVGQAAQNGLLAAALARQGFTAPPDALEGRSGFAAVLSSGSRITQLPTDFSRNLELAQNSYKPYPCGIVAHPAIDAAVALAARLDGPDAIEQVIVHCHPLVPELMGNPDPRDGLQARFSAIHGTAAGLLDGTVGLAQFTDERVTRPDAVALRARIRLVPSPEIARDEVRVEVRLRNGRVLDEHVLHARGSLDRPLTDAELFAKAGALIEPVLPGRTDAVRAAVGRLETAASLDELIAAVTAAEDLPAVVGVGPIENGIAGGSARGVTEALVAFASGELTFPAEVAAFARSAVQHVVAAALAADRDPAVTIALQAVQDWHTPPEAAVLGRGERLCAQWAAFVNGIAAENAVVPAALALAEHVHADGRALVEAVAAGLEVERRLARAVGAAHTARGWDLAGTLGHFGAVVAAARILGLRGERVRNALGIAATQAAGLHDPMGTMVHAFSAGKAAADGVASALLAQGGFTGPVHPLEGRRGFAALQAPRFESATFTDGLGARWSIAGPPEPTGTPEAVLPVALHALLDGLESLSDTALLAAAARRAS